MRSRDWKNISAVDQSIVDFIYRRQDIEDPEDFKIVEQVHQEKWATPRHASREATWAFRRQHTTYHYTAHYTLAHSHYTLYTGPLSTTLSVAHYPLHTGPLHLGLHWPQQHLLSRLHRCVRGDCWEGEIEYNLLFKPICLLLALAPWRENIKQIFVRTFSDAKLVWKPIDPGPCNLKYIGTL